MAADIEVEPEEGFGATGGQNVGVANPSLNELHDQLHRGFVVAKNRDNRRVSVASVPSPLVGVDLAKFATVVTRLDRFIPRDAGPVEIDQEIFDEANIFQAKDEKELQQRLCTFLKGQGFSLPEDQIRKATRGRTEGAVYQEANERARSTLMGMYGKDLGSEEEAPPMKKRRVSLASQVKTSSLCDVSVNVASNSKDFKEELLVGELKHTDSYTTSHCIAQALLYMQTVLYWLRVPIGLPVQSVYGFAVCGPRCQDVGDTYYTINLLRMSTPARLGDKFVCERWPLQASSISDKVPMETLMRFLTQGRRGMASAVGNSTQLAAPDRAPAYFALPDKFWSDASREYKLVRGGTVAIVFRATLNGVLLLLNNNHHYRLLREVWWGFRWLEKTKNLLLMLGRQQQYPYFVKFQVPGVSNGVCFDFCNLDRDKFSAELKETYPIVPGRIQDSYCLVMRNRGEAVHGQSFSSLDELKSAFKCVWDTAHELCTMLPPCDTLVHNMVYDGRSLHLIDVDEGRRAGTDIKERIADDGGRYASILHYPNCLRARHKEYALVQLAVSFVEIALMNDSAKRQAHDDEQFALLMRELDRLGQNLELDPDVKYEMSMILPASIADPLAAIDQTMTAWFQ